MHGPPGNFPNEFDAYRAWVDTVNGSGGISGHPVKFVSIDDHGNPGDSESAVKTLIQSDHAIAIVDLTNDDEGWASYVQSAERSRRRSRELQYTVLHESGLLS